MAKGSTLVVAATLLAAVGLGLYLGLPLLRDDAEKTFFIDGVTSDAHHQLEARCELCHLPFAGLKQGACEDCHGADLEALENSHPVSLFQDPRNADQLERIDARDCRTCHDEHLADVYPDYVTIAPDFCMACHGDVSERHQSHAELPADGCRDCHNYHDNTALYEAFLAKHLDEPMLLDEPTVAARNLLLFYRRDAEHPLKPLAWSERDAPAGVDSASAADWADSAHAAAGVNCSACHLDDQGIWGERPDQSHCRGCHDHQVEGFLAGKHGMRLAYDLPPMSTADGRLAFTAQAKTMRCNGCHPAHGYNTGHAAVDACLGCHADEHSLAYKRSSHYRLWQDEQQGTGALGTGVSCATCHLPRISKQHLRAKFMKRKRKHPPKPRLVKVEHNQSANLHPNQKMIRTVCQNCHGLELTLDALADRELILGNFAGKPARGLGSLEMVKQRQ